MLVLQVVGPQCLVGGRSDRGQSRGWFRASAVQDVGAHLMTEQHDGPGRPQRCRPYPFPHDRENVSHLLTTECHARGLPVTRDPDSRSSSRASRLDTADVDPAADLSDELLAYYDSGQGAKFFQDHPAAMAVFRRFLEFCPSKVGTVQDLLPFYALPYVPDPTLHPAFRPVFQGSWVQELRGQLCGFIGRRAITCRPSIFSYLHHHRHHASSVGQALVAQESAASAVRSQRILRRRVSWELTQALEAAVRGERVDLEGTLAACTHRYPELFTLSLTADTTAGPATILLESMQRCRRRPGVAAPIAALDFERVRVDLGAAPETHVLLLLQALRHRVTRVTTGSVRQAVVTAYVRGDVLGVRGSCRSWSRVAGALTSPQPQMLAQTAARLINALTAFNAGRTYLASEEVCGVLLRALRAEQPDSATTDMALAALQKLSIRGVVQVALIEGGAVEWLVSTLADSRALTHYTQEYAAALLMNLTLRSAGRARCHPLGKTLLPALAQLLTTVPSHVVPYVTGALYSLLSHSSLRQEAFDMGLDSTLKHLAQQSGGTEQRRQLEYIVEQIGRDPPLSPPPSPDPVLDIEELDIEDPVRAPPHAPAGEDLLAWRYTLHPGEAEEADRRRDVAPVRSAPVVPWDPRPQTSTARPNSDGFVIRHHHAQTRLRDQLSQHEKQQAAGGQWDYPSDSEAARSSMYTSRSKSSEVNDGGGGDNGKGDDSYCEMWEGSKEVEEWALSLRVGRSPPLPRRQDSQEHQLSPPEADVRGRLISEGEESVDLRSSALLSPRTHTARTTTTVDACPAEALVPYFTRPPPTHEDHPQNSSGTSGISQTFIKYQDDDDDVTVMSTRPHTGPPLSTVEYPSLHDSTFTLRTMHDRITEEEDERGANAARIANHSQEMSSDDVREGEPHYNKTMGTTDSQYSNTMGTSASQEKESLDITKEPTDPENKPMEAEQEAALERRRDDNREKPAYREEVVNSREEDGVALTPATEAAPPSQAEERVESVVPPVSERGTQHVVRMPPSEAPSEALKEVPPEAAHKSTHEEAPKRISTEAPKRVLKGAHKEVPRRATKEVPKKAPKEAHKDAPKEAPKEASEEIPKEVTKEAMSRALEVATVEVLEVKMLPRRSSVTPPRLVPTDPHKGYDLVASQLLQQLVGESRNMTAPTTVPEADPLLRSLPPPKASEYKVAFSSRPRLARTPPGSAASSRVPQISSGVSPNSPRHVLPPISRTNLTYTRAVT
ncbi:LisH domain-containing protein ARMC9-like [Homarus americanus]|uniref:LisH domain-containing protein ARMC9-like n=1 Tax=Homarus americanus TaxID=6706 RepID=A0A8J5JT50_HOMAM|nr:LisH domain-containing protein ARMC9-like [Homarus americanus]